MPEELRLVIFIILCILLGLFFIVLFLYTPFRRFMRSNFTIRSYYKKVRQVVLDHDYYLINQWERSFGEGKNETVHIDHIVVGNKFIYVIRDRYYEGVIIAKENDLSWYFQQSRHRKKAIDNPMLRNHERADYLATLSSLNRAYFISVVLVNDDCLVTPFESRSQDSFLVPISKLDKFIEANENRTDVEPFHEKEIALAVKDLADLNENGKRK